MRRDVETEHFQAKKKKKKIPARTYGRANGVKDGNKVDCATLIKGPMRI